MIIIDELNREAEYGRVKIERNYDDFTQSMPNWLELVNCTLSENADGNAVLTRTSSASTMKLQTKLYNMNNLCGIRLLLGNMTSDGIEKIELISEDGNTKLSVKKEANGKAGMYVNDTFIKYANNRICFATRTDVNDVIGNIYFAKSQTIGLHFLPQNPSFNLFAYGGDMGEHIVTTAFNINQKFRIAFEWNLATITFSQAKLILWKSY